MTSAISLNIDPNLAGSLFEHIPTAAGICNSEDELLWCNSSFLSLFGLTQDDLKQKKISDLISEKLKQSEEESKTYVTRTDNDEQRYVQMERVNFDQAQNAVAILFQDVSEKQAWRKKYEELEARYQELRTTDEVSGLLNQRAMLQNLEPLVSRSRRYENPLSLLGLEFLSYQLIADRHGKELANRAIVELSHLLKDHLRWADIIARVSDTRILIILPETEQVDALYLANKILDKVSELDIRDQSGMQIPVDTCYSVSSWSKGNDSRLLLNRTYLALEKAIVNGARSIVEA